MTPLHSQHHSQGSAADPGANAGGLPTEALFRTALRGGGVPRAERQARAARGSAAAQTRRVLPLLVPVALAGAAAATASAWELTASRPSADMLAGMLALLVASAIAEAFPVPIEGVAVGRTSLATIFVVATAVLYGWEAATVVAVLTMGVIEIGRRKPFSRVVYNTAVYALAAGAAGAVAAAIEGTGVARTTAATVGASSAFYLANITLLAGVIARWTAQSWFRSLVRFLYLTVVPFGVMACLTVILVVLWDRSPYVAVVLAGPLASIVLYEHRMHAGLRRLRELDRLKDEFIAVVSHELRTPLASVYGAAMTLERRALDQKDFESLLRVIYRESGRLARLVDQVLWASRLESDRADVTLSTVDAVELSREVVDAARAHLPPGLSLELEYDATAPPVLGDPEKVKQVLVNLVENAVKYSPDGGRIELRLAPDNGHLQFTVQDEGLGIPISEQRRIFEKFHRLDPNLRRGVGGTGLGLYICRELLHRMNGEIWVMSEVGKGSAFTFELPRADVSP
jgi:signal transduction histidine kinase